LALDLITNPKIGVFGTVQNTGAEAVIDSNPISIHINTAAITIDIAPAVLIEINENNVEVSISPDIIGVVVNTSPINI
jgi:hypothetical protein